jgi:hypothetical protein
MFSAGLKSFSLCPLFCSLYQVTVVLYAVLQHNAIIFGTSQIPFYRRSPNPLRSYICSILVPQESEDNRQALLVLPIREFPSYIIHQV